VTRSEAARLIYFAETITSLGDALSHEPTPEYETPLSREPKTRLRLYAAQPAGYEIEILREPDQL